MKGGLNINKKEFAKLAMALRTFYPKENILPNKESMELWYEELEDIPYEIASTVLRKWVTMNKWSPSIADIREMTAVIFKKTPEWGKAWEEVLQAISFYGSYRISEALETLSPLTRKATERIGFKNLCMSEKPEIDRANFRMIYENLAKEEKEKAVLPKKTQVVIENLIKQKMLGGE